MVTPVFMTTYIHHKYQDFLKYVVDHIKVNLDFMYNGILIVSI